MDEYREPYIILFRAITLALEELNEGNIGLAKMRLKAAQQDAEERFISLGDDPQ